MALSLLMKQSILPVTSLKFVVVSEVEYLLAGEGPFLKLFSKDGKLLCTNEVLPFKVVHGIRPLQSDTISGLLLIFGQKGFRLIQIVKRGAELSLQFVSEVVELADWILDGNWIRFTDLLNYEVGLVTAHNVLVRYKVVKGLLITSQYCSEVHCILYSALIDSCLGGVVVASGTVFNHILLWHVTDECVESGGHMHIRISFIGHQGVIFSVRMNSESTKLVSASDDRTIRIWNIPSDWKSNVREEDSSCFMVLYGHTARVWSAMILPECILSIGEDATCRVWSHSGQTLDVFQGHRGKSIWSMAVDKDCRMVATGGGDCSIRMCVLKGSSHTSNLHSWYPSPLQHKGTPRQTTAIPRCVFLMGQIHLCLMDQGSLFVAQPCMGGTSTDSLSWSEIHNDFSFSGYSIGALSPFGSHILALGNIHGSIEFIKLDKNGFVASMVLVQLHDGKVFSLNWCLPLQESPNDTEFLFSCGPDGKVICWEVKTEPLKAIPFVSLTLPSSKHQWITTVSILPHPATATSPTTTPTSDPFMVLCGDRKGSLHLYQLTPHDLTFRDPCQTLRGIHGPHGVTHSCLHKNAIYTCGRNGLCRKFLLKDSGNLEEATKFKPVKGLDWIEKMCFTDGDMLVVGFHGNNLVIHSTAQNRRILKVKCGGGHRSYAISSMQEILSRQSARILFIKQAEVCYCQVELDKYLMKSLIQQPFVGLEAVSLVILNADAESGRALIAVGSEDTNINLLRLHPREILHDISLDLIHTIQGHVSSVKALSCSQSSDKSLLFSGGARASLKVWSISVSEQGEDVEVHQGSELFLHETTIKRKKQKVKFEPRDPETPPECRVMCLTSFPLNEMFPGIVFEEDKVCDCHYVAAGCSDAVIRQYVYNEKDHYFSSLQTLKASDKCVLSVKHFFHQDRPIAADLQKEHVCHPFLCLGSSNGYVSVWDITPFIMCWKTSHSISAEGHMISLSTSPVISFQVHQSGVNDIAIQRSQSLYSMVTVGDDNALGLTYLTVSKGSEGSVSIHIVGEHINTTAHSSSITGACFTADGLVMTTSLDQRLNIWKLAREEGIQLVSSQTHDVADCVSLAAYNTRQDGVVAVFCGIGIQCYLYSK